MILVCAYIILKFKISDFSGTHGYMAPEVLHKGQSYDSSADWFSFGCMLYKLLKGWVSWYRTCKYLCQRDEFAFRCKYLIFSLNDLLLHLVLHTSIVGYISKIISKNCPEITYCIPVSLGISKIIVRTALKSPHIHYQYHWVYQRLYQRL